MNTIISPKAAAPLFTCPRCNRWGFYARGLIAHVCRGDSITDRRRRLTPPELLDALKASAKKEGLI